MFGAVAPGRSRWLRLRPADAVDVLLVAFMLLGLVLYVASGWIDPPGMTWAWLQTLAQLLLAVHGSTPLFLFLAALVYLVRWGRCLGRDKVWLVAGFAITVPLWFLGGLPLAVKGLGDVTALMVPWNLLAFAVMMVGVFRSLHPRANHEGADR